MHSVHHNRGEFEAGDKLAPHEDERDEHLHFTLGKIPTKLSAQLINECPSQNTSNSFIMSPQGQQQNAAAEFQVHILDLFLSNAETPNRHNALSGIIYGNDGATPSWKQKLKGIDQYTSKKQFFRAIHSMPFKDRKQARSYYFLLLIGQILKNYAKSTGSTSNDQLHSSQRAWLDFELLYSQFLNAFLNRPFVSIQHLLQIDYFGGQRHSTQSNLKLDTISKIKFKVCEHFIMKEVLSNIYTRKDRQQTAFKIFDYIERSHFLKRLDELYDRTAREIHEFWKIWSHEDPSIRMIFKKGRGITRAIEAIKNMTEKVQEDSLYILSDVTRYNMRMQFHAEILNDPLTAAQMQATLKNRLMFSCHKKSSDQPSAGNFTDLINNIGGETDMQLSEQGICLVSALNNDIRSLDFLFANKAFGNLLGLKRHQLEGKNIKLIMPSLIRQNHDHFISRFFAKGAAKVLGQERVTFVKCFDGFISPVRFKLEFSYDLRFHYAFIGSFERLSHICVNQEEKVRVHLSDTMVILTDENNKITDFSQTMLTLCGFHGPLERWKQIQEVRGHKFSMEHMIIDFTAIMERQVSAIKSILGEYEDRFSIMNIPIQFRRFDRYNEEFSDDTFKAVMFCIQEVFACGIDGQKVKQRTFLVVPLSRYPDTEPLNGIGSDEFLFHQMMSDVSKFKKADTLLVKSGNTLRNGPQAASPNSKPFAKIEVDVCKPQAAAKNDVNSSLSGSVQAISINASGSSNSGLGLDSGHFQKNLFFQNKAPRILAICTSILTKMLMAFIIVSIYNLIVFVIKHSDISSRIQTYDCSLQRNMAFRSLLLELSVLHQFAVFDQYYQQSEFNETEWFGNQSRKQLYKEQFTQQLIETRDLQQKVDMYNMMYTADQKFDQNIFSTLFLSDEGHDYQKNLTFKSQLNLFMSYFEMIDLSTIEQEKPALNASNYPYRIDPSNKDKKMNRASDIEKLLYYIHMNGLSSLQERATQQILSTLEASNHQSRESRETLQISTEASCVIVSVILVGIIPLLIAISNRRYGLIKFLMLFNNTQVDAAIEKSHAYLVKAQSLLRAKKEQLRDPATIEEVYEDPMKSESRVRPELLDQLPKLKYNKSSMFQTPQSEGSINKSQYTAGKQTMCMILNNQGFESFKQQNMERLPTVLRASTMMLSNINLDMDYNEDLNFEEISTQEIKNPVIQRKKTSIFKQKAAEEEQKTHKNVSDHTHHTSRTTHPPNEDKSLSISIDEGEHQNLAEEANAKEEKDIPPTPENEETKNTEKLMNLKIQQRRMAWREKFQIIIIVCICIGFLNSSLLVTQYYGNKVFVMNEDSSEKLKIYFERESCAYNVLLFLMDQLITNQTTTTRIYQSLNNYEEATAVPELIKYCLDTENKIASVYRSVPEYFSDAEQILINQEGKPFCNRTFGTKSSTKARHCELAINGLLMNGLDAGINYLISLVTQINIGYQSHPMKRTQEYLNETLLSPRLQEMVDLVIFFMKQGFMVAQNAAIISMEHFFVDQKMRYLLVFSVFMAVTIIVSIIAGNIIYKAVKLRILEIQNILILTPLIELQASQRHEVEKYLSS